MNINPIQTGQPKQTGPINQKNSQGANPQTIDNDLMTDPTRSKSSTNFKEASPTTKSNFFSGLSSFVSNMSQLLKQFSFAMTSLFSKSSSIVPKDATIQDVLDKPAYNQRFENFLKSEYSQENIQFYNTVSGFGENNPPTLSQVKAIYNQYVKEGSDQQANLPQRIVTAFENKLADAEAITNPAEQSALLKDIFNEAKDEIVALMRRDSFPRFMESDFRTN